MVAPSVGAVVLVRFPFSDLTSSKVRPAVVLADAERGDWILCQITSNPYADPRAIELTDSDFQTGTLQRISYARPAKLFTANSALMASTAGVLSAQSFTKVIEATVSLLKTSVDSFK